MSIFSGSNANDWFLGTSSNDIFWGYGGTDALIGAEGDDIFFKNSGGGWINGGLGTDWLSFYYAYAPVNVQVVGSSGYASHRQYPWVDGDKIDGLNFNSIEKFSGSNFSDVFNFRESDFGVTVYGFEADDFLLGSNYQDSLNGGTNRDLLVGGGGADTLSGGSGPDEFWFTIAGGSKQEFDTGDFIDGEADAISDFSAEEGDTILVFGESETTDDYTFVGDSATPNHGEYGIWENTSVGGYIITFNQDGSLYDIIVLGDDPTGSVFLNPYDSYVYS